jgi:hypothetical protein
LVQPIGTYYTDTLLAGKTYYFSAQTFDLPMDVYFTTLDSTCSEQPQIWADLTCTPGIYSDPNIQELIRDTAKYDVSVPMSVNCETDYIDGHYVHHIKIGKSYRNKLKLVGVDYSVPAYVKVIMPCTGVALMEQDTSAQACVKDARRMELPDNTHVLANDSFSTYIFPYKDWLTKADSVALYWDGPEPAKVWVEGNNCEFETDLQHVWDVYDIPANGEFHLSKALMKNASENGTQDSAGFLFAKIVSAEEGQLYTRPLIPDLKGATLLHYNTPQTVTVTDDDFYCFPTDWETVEWIANTRKVVRMYLYTSPGEAAIDSFKFDLRDSTRRVLEWTKPEMSLITAKATSAVLFVRFACSREEFKLTPYELSEIDCFGTTVRVHSCMPVKTGKNYVYRFYYADWQDYPIEIQWETPVSNQLQNLFIADICSFETNYRNSNTKNHTAYYKQTKRGGETWTVDSATVAGWVSRITPEGYFYIRTTADGTITFITAKPEEQDPEGDDPEDPDPGPATGIEQQQIVLPCKKILHNGQILIIRAGKAYTITGQTVKIE